LKTTSEVAILNMLAKTIVFAAFATASVVSFAQSSAPLTRAQVKSELAQLEKAGYSTTGSDLDYPESLTRAEARLESQRNPASNRSERQTGYGGNVTGTSDAGSK
jgi:hypothetical protein